MPFSEKSHSLIQTLIHMNLTFQHLNRTYESKFGLSLVQIHLLRCLKDQPGVAAQELAVSVGIHPSTLTQSLKRMLKKGLIVVHDDPKDSRKKKISLTRIGFENLRKQAHTLEQFNEIIGDLEISALMKLTKSLDSLSSCNNKMTLT